MNDTFVSEFAVITAILIVMCILALITQWIGVNTVLGAFVAGVLVGESPILSQHIEGQLRGFITAFMMPIFFGLSGLSADLTILKNPVIVLWTMGLVAVASIGKFGGAFVGGIAGGLSARELLALGCGMNARGSTEVIVATIGLTLGVLSQNLYTMIVTMAVVTTMAMPPMLRWALRNVPMRQDEKKRHEKEEIDARGFVSRFERLLVAADESPNGIFVMRIAGFIAGQRGLPVTVLHMTNEENVAPPIGDGTTPKEIVAEGAKMGHRAAAEDKGEVKPEAPSISTRVERNVNDAVAKEAPKGYDGLFVGVAAMCNGDGSFTAEVDRAAAGFEGPLTLAIAGRNSAAFENEGFNILVPVNGTEASRRGAEMAFAMSSAKAGSITILHISDGTARGTNRRSLRSGAAQRKTAKAVLEDARALAARYGHTNVRTAVHSDVAPDAAILEEAERCGAEVIVIGASKRVGEQLYLGQTVAHILKSWKRGAVIVAA